MAAAAAAGARYNCGLQVLKGGPTLQESSMPDIETKQSGNINATWFFGLFGVIAIILAVVVFFKADQTATVASLVIGIVAICVLLAFLPILGTVESFSVGPSGLSLKRVNEKLQQTTQQLEQTTTDLNAAREKLDRFIFLNMPKSIYDNLKKIAGPQLNQRRFGKFDMTEEFRGQLRFLRDNRYITIKGGSVSRLPRSGEDLSEFVDVAPLGVEFIENRERYVPPEASADSHN
jgi:hypothetical protein